MKPNIVHRSSDGWKTLVMAEVAASPRWRARVSELLVQARSADDHLLLLVPPRLLAGCQSMLQEVDHRAHVLCLRAAPEDPADRPAIDAQAMGKWLGACPPARLAWLPADAAYVPPDWESLTKTRCLLPWLPRYDLPRDRHLEQQLTGPIGWLATGDLLDLSVGLHWPLGESFSSLVDTIHRGVVAGRESVCAAGGGFAGSGPGGRPSC